MPAPAGPGPAPTAPPPPPRAPLNDLSTAQKQQVHSDPAVREVLSLFGGEVVDIRRDDPPKIENDEDKAES